MPRVRRNGGSSNTSSNPGRTPKSGDSNMRTKSTIKRLNMYRSGAPIRNKKGKIIGGYAAVAWNSNVGNYIKDEKQ